MSAREHLIEVFELLHSCRSILQRHPTDVLMDGSLLEADAEGISQLRRWADSVDSTVMAAHSSQHQEDPEYAGMDALSGLIDMDIAPEQLETSLEGFAPELLKLALTARRLSIPRHCEAGLSTVAERAQEIVARLGLKQKKRHECLMLSAAVHRMIQDHQVGPLIPDLLPDLLDPNPEHLDRLSD